MPIYEYRCKRCGTELEAIQKFSDKPLRKCRECSGPLEKLISQSSFQLKGTGWYVTDYANKSKPSSEKDSESKSSPDGKSGDKGTSASGKSGESGKSGNSGKSDKSGKSGQSGKTGSGGQ